MSLNHYFQHSDRQDKLSSQAKSREKKKSFHCQRKNIEDLHGISMFELLPRPCWSYRLFVLDRPHWLSSRRDLQFLFINSALAQPQLFVN